MTIYDVVYIDMVADLFHYGHVEYIKQCKSMARILKVGIHSDADVQSYKRLPIITMEERISVVGACKYVDEVIPFAPLKVDKNFLTTHSIEKVIHGNDISTENINKMYGEIIDNLILVPYTEGVSTSEIIKRIKDSL